MKVELIGTSAVLPDDTEQLDKLCDDVSGVVANTVRFDYFSGDRFKADPNDFPVVPQRSYGHQGYDWFVVVTVDASEWPRYTRSSLVGKLAEQLLPILGEQRSIHVALAHVDVEVATCGKRVATTVEPLLQKVGMS